jgi:hypothetical protein
VVSFRKRKEFKDKQKAFEEKHREELAKHPAVVPVLDLSHIGLPRKLLTVIKEIYNHPQTNKHTKDLIRFELKKVLGNEFDIKEYLDE